MPVLVRKLKDTEPGDRLNLTSPTITAPRSGRDTDYWVPQVGSNNPDDHTSRSECHLAGFAIRLETEADQPQRKGQAW